MVASIYAYYSHLYSRFHTVDFNEWVLYSGDEQVFVPQNEHYVLLFYSSYQEPVESVLARLHNPDSLPVLALDLSQSRAPTESGVIYVTAGINTLLNYLRRFGIERSPTAIVLEQQGGTLYKQDSLRLEL